MEKLKSPSNAQATSQESGKKDNPSQDIAISAEETPSKKRTINQSAAAAVPAAAQDEVPEVKVGSKRLRRTREIMEDEEKKVEEEPMVVTEVAQVDTAQEERKGPTPSPI